MNKTAIPFLCFLVLVYGPMAQAQTTQTWNTNTAGSDWSGTTNWTPTGDPAGNDLVFGDSFGETADATTVGNIVDQDYTVNSLIYNNTGTSGNYWQVTQISGGVTLTLDSASGSPPSPIFMVGGVASQSTRAAILGAGTLTISEPTSSIYVGGPTANRSTLLDMSGLAAFNATVDSVDFGGTGSRANGDVNLADTNVLTATTLNLGTSTLSTGGSSHSDLQLGTSNTFNIDTINVGLNYGSGTIFFRSGLTGPTVTVRGSSGGTSRADLTIADTGSTSIGNPQDSTVDLRGGSVDMLLDDVLIARRGDANANDLHYAEFFMDAGTVDANSVVLGQTGGGGNAAALTTATFQVEGGSFTVNNNLVMAQNTSGDTNIDASLNVSGGTVHVSGDVVAGDVSGTASSVAATVNVGGGTLVIDGDLAEGNGPSGITSTVNLSSGALDMTHGNISVDTFDFTGGSLKNVASFEAGTSGGLDLQNASTLSYDLDGSFTTLSLTGTLTLGASSNLELSLADGFTPGSSFILVGNDLGEGISGTFAAINGGAFGAGDSFSLTNDLGTFDFVLSYTGGDGNDLVVQAVPEPSACVLLIGGCALLGLLRRRAA